MSYTNSSIVAFSVGGGNALWNRIGPAMYVISEMSCLPRNEGLIGCGYGFGITNFFSMSAQGDTNWMFSLIGDNIGFCEGLV